MRVLLLTVLAVTLSVPALAQTTNNNNTTVNVTTTGTPLSTQQQANLDAVAAAREARLQDYENMTPAQRAAMQSRFTGHNGDGAVPDDQEHLLANLRNQDGRVPGDHERFVNSLRNGNAYDNGAAGYDERYRNYTDPDYPYDPNDHSAPLLSGNGPPSVTALDRAEAVHDRNAARHRAWAHEHGYDEDE